MKSRFFTVFVNGTPTRLETLGEVNKFLRSMGIRSVTVTKDTQNGIIFNGNETVIEFFTTTRTDIPFVQIGSSRYLLDTFYSFSIFSSDRLPLHAESAIAELLLCLNLPNGFNQIRMVRQLLYQTGHEAVTKEGRFHRRLSKQVKRLTGVNLPDSLLEKVATIHADYVTRATQTGFFKFTRDFSWDRGTFKDYGSCFWTQRKNAKRIILRNGGVALQVFDVNKVPLARTWVAFQKESILLFNGYGWQTREQAEIISSLYPNSYVKPVQGTNNGEKYGTLFINSGVMYVVTTDQMYPESVDLTWR